MARNLIKTIFLLIITLITIGLLITSLVSHWWIRVNDQNLAEVQVKYQQAYSKFSDAPRINSGPSTLLKADEKSDPTTTTTTTHIPTTTTEIYDYENYEYGNDYSASDNKKFKRSDTQTVVDYVYIMQLWPLIKFKSFYSECIEYKEFPMKISTAYLVQTKKEPLFGVIDYGRHLNELLRTEQAKPASDQCEYGKIRCVLSQQCVQGSFCDGKIDCSDQSDEQQCQGLINCPNGDHQCDNKCWKSWQVCDGKPHCSNLSDELNCKPDGTSMYEMFSRMLNLGNSTETDDFTVAPTKHRPLTLGQYHYVKEDNCFMNYFDFKGAKDVEKDNFQFLSGTLIDHIQLTNNNNYYMQLIYSSSFAAALCFHILALMSLLFVICLKKLCFQCPFWFYGFFSILAWLSSLFGLLTFLYQCFSNKQHKLDPMTRLPSENELLRLNQELNGLQEFGVSFWLALAATSMSFFSSFASCIVCCRLPTARHEDKEYKIMQLPTYS